MRPADLEVVPDSKGLLEIIGCRNCGGRLHGAGQNRVAPRYVGAAASALASRRQVVAQQLVKLQEGERLFRSKLSWK